MASTEFGARPKVGRVFVRVQEMDADGKVIKTQSMTIWGAAFERVLGTVVNAFEETFGNGAPLPEPPVLKGKVGKGRKP